MTKILASKTEWEPLTQKSRPPSGVYILLRGKMVGTDSVYIALGYWSDRAGTFMNMDDGYALMETLDLEDYYIITDKDGNYIDCISESPLMV